MIFYICSEKLRTTCVKCVKNKPIKIDQLLHSPLEIFCLTSPLRSEVVFQYSITSNIQFKGNLLFIKYMFNFCLNGHEGHLQQNDCNMSLEEFILTV